MRKQDLGELLAEDQRETLPLQNGKEIPLHPILNQPTGYFLLADDAFYTYDGRTFYGGAHLIEQGVFLRADYVQQVTLLYRRGPLKRS